LRQGGKGKAKEQRERKEPKKGNKGRNSVSEKGIWFKGVGGQCGSCRQNRGFPKNEKVTRGGFTTWKRQDSCGGREQREKRLPGGWGQGKKKYRGGGRNILLAFGGARKRPFKRPVLNNPLRIERGVKKALE